MTAAGTTDGAKGGVRGWAAHLLRALGTAGSGYGRHGDTQLAAATAYRVLFSLVPLVALIIGVADLLLPEDLRTRLVTWLQGVIPGDNLDASVERAVGHAGVSAGVTTVLALVALLWAASGMMASIRTAFRLIWETDGLPYVRGKLLDFMLVLATGIVAAVAFGLTILVQTISEIGHSIAGAIGVHGDGKALSSFTQLATSLTLTVVVLLFLYRTVPPVRPRFGALWPAALIGGIGFHAATAVYGFYLSHFASYNAIYGSLGALLGFLLVVYVGAAVVLFGGEVVAAWPRTEEPGPPGEPVPLRRRLAGAVRGLFVRDTGPH